MPNITIFDRQVHYLQEGQGADVICLYGWAQDTRMFEPTLHHLSKHFRVTCPDFPGFGQSELMKNPWGVSDYVEWLKGLVRELNLDNPIIIAHSFGARVALRYAVEQPVRKLILTGAAGLKPKRGLDYYIRVYTYKALKPFKNIPALTPLLKQFGSSDYKALDGVLRQSFVKIVNEDLRWTLPKIDASTLLVWGELDDATPLWMGRIMEKEMKDAGLVVFEKDDHYAYWHQPDRFHRIIDAFLKDEIHG